MARPLKRKRTLSLSRSDSDYVKKISHGKGTLPLRTDFTVNLKTEVSPSESEGTSQSDIEEHAYSKPKSENKSKQMNKESECRSKHAMLARKHRLKKKKHVEDLERQNEILAAENDMLKRILKRKAKEILSLRRETVNLRNVIKNSTEIGSFLRLLHQNTNLQISSSLVDDISSHSSSDSSTHLSYRPTPTTSNELSPAKEQGKDEFRPNNLDTSTYSPKALTNADNCSNNGKTIFNFDLDQILPDFENKVSRFELSELESIECSKTNEPQSFLRCETPSTGFDIFSNKEVLFDDVGLCLHIANKKLSLEFCDVCNQKALSVNEK